MLNFFKHFIKFSFFFSEISTYFRLNLIKVAALTCSIHFSKDILKFVPVNYSESSILKTIFDMAPTFSETMFLCSLFDIRSNCTPWFFPTVTEDGVCYVFNTLNLKELSTQEYAFKRMKNGFLFSKKYIFLLRFIFVSD